MKKNVKIGLGLAMISAISLAAAMPVFADVKPDFIERTGTAAAISSTINVDEQGVFNEAEETAVTEKGNGSEDKRVATPDFEKSPNFCRLDFDPNLVDKESPEAKPSDYKDEAIRKLAEEYKAKGYFLTDCRYEATKHSSGFGSETEYVFCNGFTAVDNNKGNNTLFIEAVKCTQAEFDWYSGQVVAGTKTKQGKIIKHTMENNYVIETMSYNPETEVLLIEINFKPYAIQNGVG